jgi:hypothetical protein
VCLIACPMEMDGISGGTNMNTTGSIPGDSGGVKGNAGAVEHQAIDSGDTDQILQERWFALSLQF